MKSICLISVFLLIVNNVYSSSYEGIYFRLANFNFDLVEYSDTYAIFNITGPKTIDVVKVASTVEPIRFILKKDEIRQNSPSRWNEVHDYSVAVIKDKSNLYEFNYLLKFSGLLPSQTYRFEVTGRYTCEIKMVAAAPQGKITKQDGASLMGITGSNAKTYYIQIDKVGENGKLETVLTSTSSASDISKTTLPDLKPGTKYSIKTWYKDNDNRDSAVTITDYVA